MSLTTNQITAAIRRKILEESTDLVTDATILMNANLAYEDLKLRSFTNDQIQSATINLVDGIGGLPADFGTLYGAGFASETDKVPFPEKSIADFDRDTAERGMTIIGTSLYVKPTSTGSIIVRYYPSYDPLTTSQNPQLNSYLHEPIIYGAMWRIHEDLQNEALSEYYRTKYEEEVTKRTGILSNYQEDNQDGNEMFTYQRLI